MGGKMAHAAVVRNHHHGAPAAVQFREQLHDGVAAAGIDPEALQRLISEQTLPPGFRLTLLLRSGEGIDGRARLPGWDDTDDYSSSYRRRGTAGGYGGSAGKAKNPSGGAQNGARKTNGSGWGKTSFDWSSTTPARSTVGRSTPPAPAAPEQKFRAGQRVRHPSWGEGLVISSRMLDGEETLDVAFESVGIKRLIASLAKLVLVE